MQRRKNIFFSFFLFAPSGAALLELSHLPSSLQSAAEPVDVTAHAQIGSKKRSKKDKMENRQGSVGLYTLDDTCWDDRGERWERIENTEIQRSCTTIFKQTLDEMWCGYPPPNKSCATLNFFGASLTLRSKKNGRRVKKVKYVRKPTNAEMQNWKLV